MEKQFCKFESIDKTAGKVLYSAFLLWLISKKPIHGYDIIKVLRSETGFNKVGSGHVYPQLSELFKFGLIVSKSSKKEGRSKKFYSLTASGKEHLLFLKKALFGSGIRSEFFKEMIK